MRLNLVSFSGLFTAPKGNRRLHPLSTSVERGSLSHSESRGEVDRLPARQPILVSQIVRLGVFVALVILNLAAPRFVRAQQGKGFFGASTEAIDYVGRTQRSNSVLWTWPATGLRVMYSNSGTLSLHFRAPDLPEESTSNRVKLIWYRIDSSPWQQLSIPPNSNADYSLAAPADRESHLLEVVKASEGAVNFEGIILEASGKLKRPPGVAHRIEIVGDSITAGYKINGPGSFDTPADEDARATYGWLMGEQLNAEVRLVAVTGKGLVHNYGSGADARKTMPLYYPYLYREYTVPNDWLWRPEIIVVNLGTNDLGPPEPTPSAQFQSAYNDFLLTIRGFNPRSLIVALQPFGVENGSIPVYAAEIRAAVDMRHRAGDNRVMYVDTAGWLGSGDFTDGAHPNAQGNRKAANLLAAILQNRLGK